MLAFALYILLVYSIKTKGTYPVSNSLKLYFFKHIESQLVKIPSCGGAAPQATMRHQDKLHCAVILDLSAVIWAQAFSGHT